ncbi:hypothetical protein L2E82_42437 [Cichorium intybus]|uniref:Uncharacterized protein n=1 Tax=Cichorium intybus TaxID=13427 RepID=A0ACB8ZL52_CICIN|nr:hypothetical protein L2E82_42437 [Cichorium intybus]
MMKPTVIMVPYPAQGHVTPMLNLASALSRHGLSPVVVTPEFIHHTIAHKNTHITCKSIPDGLDDETPRDFFSIEFAMENNMPEHLDHLVRELNGGDDGGVAFMIVDLLASWALKVGGDCGVPVVGYWPVMFAAYQLIAAIPEMLSLGIISESGIPQNQGPIYLGHEQPPLSTEDLPWLIGNPVSRKSRFRFWTRTLARTRTLPQILIWRIGIRIDDFGEENVHRSLEKVMGDMEMGKRLVKLNERVFGMETSLRVVANLTNFVDDYRRVTNDLTLTKEY